jgi:uncharacterized membrane protein YsdA (DUF1294 family)
MNAMFENTISFSNVFNMQNMIIYLILINLIGLFIMWLDKHKAKKGKWRISEATLFLIAFLGGSIGEIVGMHMFRHKTKKKRFTIGFPAILIIEILIFTYYKFF